MSAGKKIDGERKMKAGVSRQGEAAPSPVETRRRRVPDSFLPHGEMHSAWHPELPVTGRDLEKAVRLGTELDVLVLLGP